MLEVLLSLQLLTLPVRWIETSHRDFADGQVDPQMYVSWRAQLDPDSGCVEFFSRFDVDNDGFYDLACSDDAGPNLRLYLGDTGGYLPTRRLTYPIPSGGNVELADLNLDGWAELIHSGWRSGFASIYWGTPSGPSPTDTTTLEYGGQSEDVCVYDLDKDGYLDVILGSSDGYLYIFWGSATGYSSSNRTLISLGYSLGHNIEVGDLNQDGWGDLALSTWTYNQNPIVYWGPGRRARDVVWLPGHWNNDHGLTVADFNRDGWLDLTYTSYDTVLASDIYFGSPLGYSPANRTVIHPGQCYGGSAAVDWNYDGWLDIVYLRGNWTSGGMWKPRVYFNRGTPPYFTDANYAVLGNDTLNASGGFVADFNFDGALDIFINNMVPDDSSYILWGPDYTRTTGLPADNDHHGVFREPGNVFDRSMTAFYLSSVYDCGAGNHVATGQSSWTAYEPRNTNIRLAYRSGNTPAPDTSWTHFAEVDTNGGPIPDSGTGGRFLQYRVTFSYGRPCFLPDLEEITTTINAVPNDVDDVSAIRIQAPRGNLDTGDVVTPQAVVKNVGNRPETFQAVMRIGMIYADTTTIFALLPDSQSTVSFADWTAAAGRHIVSCSTMLAPDVNPANDKVVDSVLVTAPSILDVGVEQILAPVGNVDSGSVATPAAIIRNFGNQAATFPVKFRIGGLFSDSTILTLAVGEADTVQFSAWTAAPRGTYLVKCTTALVNDSNPSNDAQTAIVTVEVHDASAIQILAPRGFLRTGDIVTPQAVVKNLGSVFETFQAVLNIGTVYRETVLAAGLLPDSVRTLSYPAWAAVTGRHIVSCSTMLARDLIPANDKVVDSVQVFVPTVLDVGVEQILAPVGNVDSGSVAIPAAIIRNFGNQAATFPVKFRIGGLYSDSTILTLAVGEADTVQFSAWTAAPRGTYSVKCTTALLNDSNPSNDAQTAIVTVDVHDVSAIQIVAPRGVLRSGDVVTPQAVVKNLGSVFETFQAVLNIGTVYSETVLAAGLLPDSVRTLSYPTWTAVTGRHIVSCSTMLAGDMDPLNDKALDSVQVNPPQVFDVAVEEIVAPAGTLDSGAIAFPAAVVRNLGTQAATFPVQFRIGGFYGDVQTVTLNPNEQDTVRFAAWTALQRGTHVVKCTAALAGDANPANDAQSGTVTVQVRDVGATRILAPVRRIHADDIVIPQATVQNFGNTTESFTVIFRIGSIYAESTAVSGLAPDSFALVSFAPWTAVAGGYATSCSTMLGTDMAPANDKVTDTVFVAIRNLLVRPDTSGSVFPAASVSYQLRILNQGNSADTVDLPTSGTRPDWTVLLLDSAGQNPLPDFNHNGLPDIGELGAGATRWITARITAPVNALARIEDTTIVTGRAWPDTEVTDDAQLQTVVLGVASIGLAPDLYDSVAPGASVDYRLTASNLGNDFDFADLEIQRISQKPGWTYALLDQFETPLPDRNRNGKPDVGPLSPVTGAVQFRLRVSAPGSAQQGVTDTIRVWAYSGNNPFAHDYVFVRTLVAGQLLRLVVAPDLEDQQTGGETKTYSLYVETQGNMADRIGLRYESSNRNWPVRLMDETGRQPLPDADQDSVAEFGPVDAAVRMYFTVKVTAPDSIPEDLSGNIDSLSRCFIWVIGQSAGNPRLVDTAVLNIKAVPGLAIHNYENPFRDRTTFVFSVPRKGRVRLLVFTRTGELAKSLIDNQEFNVGVYPLPWDGRNDHGNRLAPGTYVYMYQLTSGANQQKEQIQKRLLIR
jgi:hypothetical protein